MSVRWKGGIPDKDGLCKGNADRALIVKNMLTLGRLGWYYCQTLPGNPVAVPFLLISKNFSWEYLRSVVRLFMDYSASVPIYVGNELFCQSRFLLTQLVVCVDFNQYHLREETYA